MAVVAVGAYLAYVSIDWSGTETTLPGSDDPNVIPLEIPPYNAPDERAADGEVGALMRALPSESC